MKYLEILSNGYRDYASYLWNEITHPHYNNYFYWLIAVSFFFLCLEWLKPWRKGQAKFRKDFWMDFFYMFFNFFLFSLIIYNAASDVAVNFFNDIILSLSGFNLQKLNPLYSFPLWSVLLIGFIVRDFVQWWIHRLLHKSKRLWEFHKVHHSVEEMGFAAHLRYHWMENVVYRTLEYIPLALLGIGLYDFFVIHIFSLTIGHYNHSNISVKGYVTAGILGLLVGFVVGFELLGVQWNFEITNAVRYLFVIGMSVIFAMLLGPFMKKIFNSPEMHIWHHSFDLPAGRETGINFGLSLAIWDYLFGTAYVPHSGRDIKLGFPGIKEYPKSFVQQNLHGFKKQN